MRGRAVGWAGRRASECQTWQSTAPRPPPSWQRHPPTHSLTPPPAHPPPPAPPQVPIASAAGGGGGPGKLRLAPVLLAKGPTRLALYGLGNLRDERLARLFQTPGAVEW